MSQESTHKELSVTLHPKGIWPIILLFLILYGLFVGVAIWNDQPLYLSIIVGIVLLICPICIFFFLSAAKVIIDSDGVTLRICGFVLRRIPNENVRLLIHHQGYKHLTTMLVLSARTQEELEAHGKHKLENNAFCVQSYPSVPIGKASASVQVLAKVYCPKTAFGWSSLRKDSNFCSLYSPPAPVSSAMTTTIFLSKLRISN